jgi:hypothetical protein
LRTGLEDKLDIFLDLDFKLTCMVWRKFVKLTSTHQARLVDMLNSTIAREVIGSELDV